MKLVRWMSVLGWIRSRLESMAFLVLVLVLGPLLFVRAITVAWNPVEGRALLARWRLFLCHGLGDLHRAYWPGLRYERTADIWFHVVLIEGFSVLNATEKPLLPSQGNARTLVLKLAHFGDALHIFPMMREWRRQCPDSILDLLVGPWCAGLARTYGLHDELILQTPRFGIFERGDRSHRRSIWQEIWFLIGLRRRRYSCVISTSTMTLVEVLLMHALRANRWVGTLLPANLYEAVGEVTLIPYDSRLYEADRVMGLLEYLGMSKGNSELFYPLSEEAVAGADMILADNGIAPGEGYAVLCPGAGWPGKQWKPERFAEIGDQLVRRFGYAVLLMGSAGEKELCSQVAGFMSESAVECAGQTSLDQLAALLSTSSVFIGNDSGPMHLAACFKRPSVVFFGPTIASKWAPRHAGAHVLQYEDCAGCISWHYRAQCVHKNRCMNAISVAEAWRIVELTLSELK